MKHLIITPMIAALVLAVPVTTQSWADDAHHPGKAAKAKKSTKAKPKQQSRPAGKTNKSKASEISNSWEERKA